MFANDFPRKTKAVTTGLIAGTLVEGATGWKPVEDLRIGDAVQSYDGGLCRVLGLDRHWIAPSRGEYLVHLPGGALDNCSDLTLLPGQHLLIDTLGDETLPEAIVVLFPAAALEGWLGAEREPLDRAIEVITPRFADDEAIFANSGTLLHCPGIRQDAGATGSDFFTQLDLGQAQAFLQRTYGAPFVQPLYRRAA
jgi:Hint domain